MSVFRIQAVSILVVALWVARLGAEPPVVPEDLRTKADFFEGHIRPVLVEHCYACHSADAEALEAGLHLDDPDGTRRGGESGEPSVVPGDLQASLLWRAINREDDAPEMPPDGKLSESVLSDFRKWIAEGAYDPREAVAPNEIASPETNDHWAFQPPRMPAIPPGGSSRWPRTNLDRLIVAWLHEAGVAPSPDARPELLVRRVYFDLIGLPPSAQEVRSFAANPSDEAYAALVDRLLKLPQFGERWARHWLDVARYADTKGYVFMEDRTYPNAFRYRDWVIQAFNRDLPYTDFVNLQLAADLLVPPEDTDSLAALGFLTLGRRFLNNRHDIIDDRIDVVSRGLLGLTVACARCHDHKYDPIPTADYYSLYGIFASSEEQGKDFPLLADGPAPQDAKILVRGNVARPGDVVPRRFLGVLAGAERPRYTQGSGRLQLAQAITDKNNPLAARVFVNRVWGHLFGTHLVTTPSDFGMRSDAPANPAVLDYLAVRFQDQGGSLKSLLREILNSSVYRQTSESRPEAATVDPENRLYWRMNRRRLDLEALRDSLLSAGGHLRLEPIGGPSERIETAPYSERRTLYAHIDRQNLPALFRTFDFASPDMHAPQRANTSVPQQALYLLNNPFAMDQAVLAAHRVSLPSTEGEEARVGQLFELILSRAPDAQEIAWSLEFLNAMANPPATDSPASDAAGGSPQSLDRWSRLAHVLMLSNEFVMLD